MGCAISDYFFKRKTAKLLTSTNVTTTDELPIPYLFRTYAEMPTIEQKALDMVKGKILDVGAAAGAHSYHLQQQGYNVTAIDNSLLSVEVMQHRGLNAVAADFFDYTAEPFDTLLFLMNGTGICGTIEGLAPFFEKCKTLMTPQAQILLDSSDLIYLFTEDDGSCCINLNGDYYGELMFTVKYRKMKAEPFKWLFVDFDTLKHEAFKCGLKCEKVIDGPHYDYLARITRL